MQATIELDSTSHGVLVTVKLPCADFPESPLDNDGVGIPYHGALCLVHEDGELVILNTHEAHGRAIPLFMTHLTGFNFGPVILRMRRQAQKAADFRATERIELPDSTLERIRSQAAIYYASTMEVQS